MIVAVSRNWQYSAQLHSQMSRMTSLAKILSRLSSSQKPDIAYCIDQLTTRGLRGWAYSPTGEVITVQVWSEGACVAESVADGYRPDVSLSLRDAPERCGFGIDFALSGSAPFLDVCVKLLARGPNGATVSSIEAAKVRLVSNAGTEMAGVAPSRVQRSSFPQPIANIILALWPDAPVESALEEDQQRVVEMVIQLARQPASAELGDIVAYVRFLRETWAHFEFVRRYFPSTNERRSSADRDYNCKPNSPEELFTIAHHLYVVRSHGVEGEFAEFGCFKGYSTSMLSYACRLLGVRMHVFDSFAGLPPSSSATYSTGEFAASLAEVTSNVRRFGAAEVVTFHQGFFAESLRGFQMPPLVSLWMDVDLESSALDVMAIHKSINPLGAVFTHESDARSFEDGRVVAARSADAVLPVIAEAFEQAGAPARGRHLAGATGVLWRRDGGIPVLAEAPLRRLLSGI
jgi:O-methyltransferase